MAVNDEVNAAPTTWVGRRLFNSRQFTGEPGSYRLLKPAFKESRPGGLSVDVLWDRTLTPASEKKILLELAAICESENADAKLLTCAKAVDLLKNMHIDAVVKSPTDTNTRHAHLVSHKSLEIVSVPTDVKEADAAVIEEENQRRVDLMALVLTDFFNGKNTFLPLEVDKTKFKPPTTD